MHIDKLPGHVSPAPSILSSRAQICEWSTFFCSDGRLSARKSFWQSEIGISCTAAFISQSDLTPCEWQIFLNVFWVGYMHKECLSIQVLTSGNIACAKSNNREISCALNVINRVLQANRFDVFSEFDWFIELYQSDIVIFTARHVIGMNEDFLKPQIRNHFEFDLKFQLTLTFRSCDSLSSMASLKFKDV